MCSKQWSLTYKFCGVRLAKPLGESKVVGRGAGIILEFYSCVHVDKQLATLIIGSKIISCGNS